MGLKRWTVTALLASVAMTALTACGDSDGGGKLEKKSFKITERQGDDDFSFSDNPPKTKLGDQGPEKLSPGDQIGFRSDLIRAGKDVGDLFAQCTVISGESFMDAGGHCTGVYQLAEGSLSGQVGGKPLFGGETTTGIITGGTGDYLGASGMFSSPNNPDETVTTVTIYVPKG